MNEGVEADVVELTVVVVAVNIKSQLMRPKVHLESMHT